MKLLIGWADEITQIAWVTSTLSSANDFFGESLNLIMSLPKIAMCRMTMKQGRDSKVAAQFNRVMITNAMITDSHRVL